MPDCFVPESPKGIHGKGFLLCLELLETNHVRLRFGQPSQEVVEPLVGVVNVEGGDSHQVPFCPCASGRLPKGTTEFDVSARIILPVGKMKKPNQNASLVQRESPHEG